MKKKSKREKMKYKINNSNHLITRGLKDKVYVLKGCAGNNAKYHHMDRKMLKNIAKFAGVHLCCKRLIYG